MDTMEWIEQNNSGPLQTTGHKVSIGGGDVDEYK